MNLSDWIDRQLDRYIKNETETFEKACRLIATHEEVTLISSNDKLATFEIARGKFKSRLTIQNTYKYTLSELEPSKILEKVAEVSGLEIKTLQSKWRKREVVEARQAYMIIAKNITTSTITDIGKEVNCHYTTVLHGLKNQHITSIQQIIQATNLLT